MSEDYINSNVFGVRVRNPLCCGSRNTAEFTSGAMQHTKTGLSMCPLSAFSNSAYIRETFKCRYCVSIANIKMSIQRVVTLSYSVSRV